MVSTKLVALWPFWMTENHFQSHFSTFQINTPLFFLNVSQNGHQRPYWMTENHFRSYFSPFQINTQLLFFEFFTKWPQYTTGFFKTLTKWLPFWMTQNHFRSQFPPFQINTQLLFIKKNSQNGSRHHFGRAKITFDRISLHFDDNMLYIITDDYQTRGYSVCIVKVYL